MKAVFISYRHESDDHCERVRQLAEDLEQNGIRVVLDVLADEREFDSGGPSDGWTSWSLKQAEDKEHIILFVASDGWFRCFAQAEKAGVGVGAAIEASVIKQRLAANKWITKDIRPVVFDTTATLLFPDSLAGYERFFYPKKKEKLLKWLVARLRSNETQAMDGYCDRGDSRSDDGGRVRGDIFRSTPPTEIHDEPKSSQLPSETESAQNSFLQLNWKTVDAGTYVRGFNRDMIAEIIGQLSSPMIDTDSVRSVLQAEPERKEHVPAFEISRELVTNAQFRQFVEATGYRTSAERSSDPDTWRNYAIAEKTCHPVVQVSFDDAQAFCQWANVRLPRLDEWMKAYRGPKGAIYPWGNKFDLRKCNTEENKSVRNTSPVDMFANFPSHYGCYDMIGNVNEWVDSSGESVPSTRDIPPAQLEMLKRTRAIMGGSWKLPCQAFGLPVVSMLASISTYSNDLGFRVAR